MWAIIGVVSYSDLKGTCLFSGDCAVGTTGSCFWMLDRRAFLQSVELSEEPDFNPFNSCRDVSLKNTTENPSMAERSEDHHSH